MHRFPACLLSTRNAIIFSDVCALTLSFFLAYLLRALTGGDVPFFQYLQVVPLILLIIPLYFALGLYPGVLRPASDELKWLTIATSIGFLFLSFLFFLGQVGAFYSRFILIAGWLCALCAVPLFRFLTRARCADYAWWGYPVVVFAAGELLHTVADTIGSQPERGLKIVGQVQLLSDAGRNVLGEAPCLPVIDPAALQHGLKEQAAAHPGSIALIITDHLNTAEQNTVITTMGTCFRYSIIQSHTRWLRQFAIHGVDIPGGPAVVLHQNLLDPNRMRAKRLLDICLCILGSVGLLIVMPAIALCIRLESKGPVFFIQKRIGMHGKPIFVYKFRTMVENAEAVLENLLANDPVRRAEWDKLQKLTDDPRLTKVGAFLRRTSLDELPQIINVLKGEMSLVGPRPILESQIELHGEAYSVYTQVKPGITGLWQVSGRNKLSYEKRSELDQEYVYNWSVWLDIYIIFRTFPVLVRRDDTY